MNLPIWMIAALMFGSAACGSDQSRATHPSTPATPIVSTVPTPGTHATTLDLSIDDAVPASGDAPLRELESLSQTREHDVRVGILSVTPQGSVLAKVGLPDIVQGGEIRLRQSRIEVITPGGASLKIPGSDGARPRQAVWGDSDERTLVWMETTSTDLYTDGWVILAHDLASRKTRVIAKAVSDKTPSAPNGTVPFLANERVYWQAAESTGDKDRPARAHIYSRDLTGSQPVRREVSNASDLSVDGQTMFYVKSRFVDPRIPHGEVQLHRRDLATGHDETLRTLELGDNERLAGLSSADRAVAWITRSLSPADETQESSTITLLDGDGSETRITGTNISFAYPVLTHDVLGWDGGDQGGQWIFVRQHNRIVDLGSAPGLADVKAAGAHVVWREGDRWRFALVTAGSRP